MVFSTRQTSSRSPTAFQAPPNNNNTTATTPNNNTSAAGHVGAAENLIDLENTDTTVDPASVQPIHGRLELSVRRRPTRAGVCLCFQELSHFKSVERCERSQDSRSCVIAFADYVNTNLDPFDMMPMCEVIPPTQLPSYPPPTDAFPPPEVVASIEQRLLVIFVCVCLSLSLSLYFGCFSCLKELITPNDCRAEARALDRGCAVRTKAANVYHLSWQHLNLAVSGWTVVSWGYFTSWKRISPKKRWRFPRAWIQGSKRSICLDWSSGRKRKTSSSYRSQRSGRFDTVFLSPVIRRTTTSEILARNTNLSHRFEQRNALLKASLIWSTSTEITSCR